MKIDHERVIIDIKIEKGEHDFFTGIDLSKYIQTSIRSQHNGKTYKSYYLVNPELRYSCLRLEDVVLDVITDQVKDHVKKHLKTIDLDTLGLTIVPHALMDKDKGILLNTETGQYVAGFNIGESNGDKT
jgi:hypothetical protein